MRKTISSKAYIPSLLSYSATARTPQPVPTLTRTLSATYASRPLRTSTSTSTTLQPPTKPLPWLWQCHICHHTYSLGTTRRCLEDGHHFCAGEQVTSSIDRGRGKIACGRAKKAKACASEFDYFGWSEVGAWKRGLLCAGLRGEEKAAKEEILGKKRKRGEGESSCWRDCDYPSECRWEMQFEEWREQGGGGSGPEIVIRNSGQEGEEMERDEKGQAEPARTSDEILGLPVDVAEFYSELPDGCELEAVLVREWDRKGKLCEVDLTFDLDAGILAVDDDEELVEGMLAQAVQVGYDCRTARRTETLP